MMINLSRSITRWFLTPLLLVSCVVAGNAQPKPDDVFDHLNLNYPGMESVKSAYVLRDLTRAKALLLEYFRNRTNRLAEFPDRFFPVDSAEAEENARNILSFKMYRHNFDREIDWRKTGEDREWNYTLNRMEWLLNYVGMYRQTRNPAYVEAWMRQIESWIKLGIPGHPRTIDTGRRMENWILSYWMLVQILKAPTVTPDFNALFLTSMAQQAEFIYRPEHWRRYSNWGTFENSGFAIFTALYPEFKRSGEWLKEIYFRMRSQLRDSYHDDGLHVETSPSYHIHELMVWFAFVALVEYNKIDEPWRPQIPQPSYRDLIMPKALALIPLLKPTGTFPQVGDTDERDYRPWLQEIADYWGNDSLRYVASGGKTGSAPRSTANTFPQGGYVAMRSGWGSGSRPLSSELFLLFDFSTNAPWHAHRDVFNIVCSAYGFDLLVDPGRFTYNENSDRARFLSSTYHNTVVVDSQDQPRDFPGTQVSASFLGTCDYATGEQGAYPGVSHRRSIFFANREYWIVIDRLQSQVPHTYDSYWHLAAGADSVVGLDPAIHAAVVPHLYLFVSDKATTSILPGEVSPVYRKKVPAPVIRSRLSHAGTVVLPTVIYPYDSDRPDLRVDFLGDGESSAANAGVWARLERRTFTDFFGEQISENGILTNGQIETDAAAVFLRTLHGDSLALFTVFRGTYLKYKGVEVFALRGDKADVEGFERTVAVRGGCVSHLRANGASFSKLLLNHALLPAVKTGTTISWRSSLDEQK